MNIRERRNKNGVLISYQIRVFTGTDKDGKVISVSTGWKVPKGMSDSKAKKEVEKFAVIFEKQVKDGLYTTENKKFSEYADYYLGLKERDGKHRTVVLYRDLLTRIDPYIGHLKLKDITCEHLNRLYLDLGKEGVNKHTGGKISNKRILEHHRLIHAILNQAVKEGLILFNVGDRATPPRVDKVEKETFTPEEVKEIMECLKDEPLKWQVMTHLMICTGARRGEIMGLKWEDINLTENLITIKRTLNYSPDVGVYEDTTKTRQSRTVAISEYVTLLLKQQLQRQVEEFNEIGIKWSEENYIFTQDGSDLPINPESITKWLSKFSTKNGLPHINPHKFRHTQASILFAEGVDPMAISRRLGHNDLATTQNIYTHLLQKSQAKANETIADVLYKNLEDDKKDTNQLN